MLSFHDENPFYKASELKEHIQNRLILIGTSLFYSKTSQTTHSPITRILSKVKSSKNGVEPIHAINQDLKNNAKLLWNWSKYDSVLWRKNEVYIPREKWHDLLFP